VQGRDFLKKVGIFAGGPHYFICTFCSKMTKNVSTGSLAIEMENYHQVSPSMIYWPILIVFCKTDIKKY